MVEEVERAVVDNIDTLMFDVWLWMMCFLAVVVLVYYLSDSFAYLSQYCSLRLSLSFAPMDNFVSVLFRSIVYDCRLKVYIVYILCNRCFCNGALWTTRTFSSQLQSFILLRQLKFRLYEWNLAIHLHPILWL